MGNADNFYDVCHNYSSCFSFRLRGWLIVIRERILSRKAFRSLEINCRQPMTWDWNLSMAHPICEITGDDLLKLPLDFD